jgi:hemerythrin-like domain-containing protein
VEAIRIIQTEHLALSAVLQGMLHIVRRVRFGGEAPDFEALDAMVAYICAFPEKFHHPTEERYLFAALRKRNPGVAPLLDRLIAEHKNGALKVAELEKALRRYEREPVAEFAGFAAAATRYAAFHWDHVRAEEFEVIPSAENFLSDEDWRLIDEAFLANADPLGAEVAVHCDALFRKIVAVVPPAFGVVRAP